MIDLPTFTAQRRKFSRSQSGSMAMMVALGFTALMCSVGIAVDFARAMNQRTLLQDAVDSAALASAAAYFSGKDAATTAGQNVLKRNIDPTEFAVTSDVVIGTGTVTVTASSSVTTSFMGLFGYKAIPVTTKAVTVAGAPPVDVYIAADLSGSMGLVATPADRTKMMALTKNKMANYFAWSNPDGCTFSCHQVSSNTKGLKPGETLYDVARANGIQIVEDIMIDSVNTSVNALLSGGSASGLRVGLYGFSWYAKSLVAPTSAPFDVTAAFNSFPYADRGRTDYLTILPSIDQDSLSKSGTRKRVLVLVTDGVHDKYANVMPSEIDVATCDKIKASGTDLYVVDVMYQENPGENQFTWWVEPFYTNITPALQACASPGKYFSAKDSTEIGKAMTEVHDSILSQSVRLTQ